MEKPIHYQSPHLVLDLLDLFKEEQHLFLLHSSQWVEGRGRYSILGFDPFEIFKTNDKDALEQLREKFAIYKKLLPLASLYNPENKELPFFSGVVGYFGYDYGLQLEDVFSKKEKELPVWNCFFGFYDCVLVFDHLKEQLWVQSSGLPETNKHLQAERASQRKRYVFNKIQKAKEEGFFERNHFKHEIRLKEQRLESLPFFDGAGEAITSNFEKGQYLKAVYKALDYIERGEIYQVNLSQRFEIDLSGKEFCPWEAYRFLMHLSPSSFGGYFDCGTYQILSSSPERFLVLKGDHVETRPMKGTRPRGVCVYTDKNLLQELIESKKEKAELLMITDLLRNDLGRVCDYGSIHVKELRHIEQYQTVFQATATIEGKLSQERDAFDLLKACFPGGSITGCPKIRAMEIIDELEPTRRMIYTGSFGYIDFSGNMDFNILIRTFLHYQNTLSFQVGGGIVYDSIPEKEYEETLVKAKALKHCLDLLFQPSRVGSFYE